MPKRGLQSSSKGSAQKMRRKSEALSLIQSVISGTPLSSQYAGREESEKQLCHGPILGTHPRSGERGMRRLDQERESVRLASAALCLGARGL